MKSGLVMIWIGILGVTAASYGGWLAYRNLNSDRSASRAPEVSRRAMRDAFAQRDPLKFELTDQSGRPFTAESMRGKVWVVSFFFTSCPGPCFRQNQALAELQKQLPDPEIQFVSITCDPATDTPERLKTYAERLDADPERWLFLTGDLENIKKLAREQFLQAIDQGTHSERALVIGRDGKILDFFETLNADDMQRMQRFMVDLKTLPAGAAS